MSNNSRTLLRLLSVKGLATRRILSLHQSFPDLEAVFGASVKRLTEVPGIDLGLADRILTETDEKFVETQLGVLADGPYELISIFDSGYPPRLKKIYDPPILLFLQGEFKDSDQDAVAIVGTRTPTAHGRDAAENLVRGLVEQNICIVSGFARGIDTTAHRAALKAGGRTIAVLGNGVDRVYPPENRELGKQIVQNGVYCSEFAFDTKPEASNFPRRNRIISGLSLGTVVIEAGEKSGALLTAYFSLDQNREVYAVPGRITDMKSRGANRLIQKGAKMVLDVEDVLSEIEAARKFPTTIRQLKIDFEFDGDEKRVYDVLEYEPLHIDEISAKAGKASYEVLSALLTLELKGAVRQLAGKMFTKIG